LTGDSVGDVVAGVVVLLVEGNEEEEEDMNCCVVLLVLFQFSFIGFEKLLGIGDVCFWFPGAFCFRVFFPVN